VEGACRDKKNGSERIDVSASAAATSPNAAKGRDYLQVCIISQQLLTMKWVARAMRRFAQDRFVSSTSEKKRDASAGRGPHRRFPECGRKRSAKTKPVGDDGYKTPPAPNAHPGRFGHRDHERITANAPYSPRQTQKGKTGGSRAIT